MGEERAGVNGRSSWYRATVYNAVHARDGTGQPQATEQQQQQQGTRCPGNDRTFALPHPTSAPSSPSRISTLWLTAIIHVNITKEKL